MVSSSLGTGHIECPPRLQDHDECSHSDPQQSSLLGSEYRSPSFEEDEDKDHAREVLSWNKLPWWRRPSPYWLICGIPLHSIGYSALLAPRVAMYTALACRVHKPEYVANGSVVHAFSFLLTNSPVSADAVYVPIPHVSDGSEAPVDTLSVFFPNPTPTASSDHPQDEPDSEQKCASDPVVQAVVARLIAVFNTGMGILSCLTTAWWGSLSDRFGRRNVLFVSMVGFLMTDTVHIITARFADVLPGGYWFPLVGFLIDGLCGSMSTGMAVTHAYLTDTTEPSTRSRYFALELGVMFTGIAVGPILGGLLMRLTGTIMSPFYLATVLDGLYAILILLILPESLTRARARGARQRRRQEKAHQAPGNRVLGVFKGITKVLSPLAILLPEQSSETNPLKKTKKDWNLSFVALSYGLVMSILGSFSYKFQYAAAQFHWTPEITSYYISFVGATRALFLAVILPPAMKYLKPPAIQLPSAPDEPLSDDIGHSPSRGAMPLPGSAQTMTSDQNTPASRSVAFELALARISAGLESAAFVSMAIASTGTLFTLASVIGSFGAGYAPAAKALALDIYISRRSQNQGEVGKLFGALSVVEALGAQIISPALYGFVYFSTVAIFPQAIMIVSICTTSLAFIFISFVRIPSKLDGDRASGNDIEGNQGVETPEILVAIEDEVTLAR